MVEWFDPYVHQSQSPKKSGTRQAGRPKQEEPIRIMAVSPARSMPYPFWTANHPFVWCAEEHQEPLRWEVFGSSVTVYVLSWLKKVAEVYG